MLTSLIIAGITLYAAMAAMMNDTTVPATTAQMNTRRRQDMARILSAFTDYMANNNGKLPQTDTELNNFVSRYIVGDSSYLRNGGSCDADARFCDPDGKPYVINTPIAITSDLSNVLGDNPSFATQNHEIHYYTQAACGDENSLKRMDSARDMAIMYVLDNGAIYCGDNQ